MKDLWNGRFDSNDTCDLRLWQVVKKFDKNIKNNAICFVGYNTDDGVVRNQGRSGAKDGSNAIRKAMQSLPNIENINFYDYGNLNSEILEQAQLEYGKKISDVLNFKAFPIGLGGGHDITYGSYLGVRRVYKNEKIGIINFDTHLDNRPYEKGGTSGTSFKQILDCDDNVEYCIIGYKDEGNTQRLRELAKEQNVLIFSSDDIDEGVDDAILTLQKWIDNVDIVYITLCMDVFDVSFAPGVSAPTIMGLEPKQVRKILREIFKNEKIVCLDVAETNPDLDIDNRTARLAGAFIYDILNYKSKKR